MKVYICWSGEQSKAFAEIFRQWLPAVIQAVKPYYTPDDITKGSRWSSEISKELEQSSVGLICLTRDNLDAQWIMFEAGALSKNIDKSKVVPILFGVEKTDIKGPLVQFQASKFEKREILKVLKMINNELGEVALSDDVLVSVFEMWWPELEEKVEKELSTESGLEDEIIRSERDLLMEILELSRLQSRRFVGDRINPRVLTDLTVSFNRAVEESLDLVRCMGLLEALSDMRRPLDYLIRTRIELRDEFIETCKKLEEKIDRERHSKDEIPF